MLRLFLTGRTSAAPGRTSRPNHKLWDGCAMLHRAACAFGQVLKDVSGSVEATLNLSRRRDLLLPVLFGSRSPPVGEHWLPFWDLLEAGRRRFWRHPACRYTLFGHGHSNARQAVTSWHSEPTFLRAFESCRHWLAGCSRATPRASESMARPLLAGTICLSCGCRRVWALAGHVSEEQTPPRLLCLPGKHRAIYPPEGRECDEKMPSGRNPRCHTHRPGGTQTQRGEIVLCGLYSNLHSA